MTHWVFRETPVPNGIIAVLVFSAIVISMKAILDFFLPGV